MNDKISQFTDKLDGKMAKIKLEKALNTLRNEDADSLKRKLTKINFNDVMEKMDEYDKQKLKQLGIDLGEIKSKFSARDFEKISEVLGKDGDQILKKIKSILR